FTPAWCLVPRCRIKIVPAFTSCPPNRLTPSLCPCESRPLVDDPPPFLCAITHSLFVFVSNVVATCCFRLFLCFLLPLLSFLLSLSSGHGFSGAINCRKLNKALAAEDLASLQTEN